MMIAEPKLDSLLSISWHDSAWIPVLNPHNVLDYFSERSNPFYDRTCNNEVIKMQRLNPEQLQHMQGVEYVLLHVQEPILYVIRKQIRQSPTQVAPLADYYIIAGIVYQAPDLGSVLNSRLLTTVSHLQSAFEEARGYAKYQPARGYWWDFGVKSKNSVNKQAEKSKRKRKTNKKNKKNKDKSKEEPSSLFQRRRVDMILDMLTGLFPPKTAEEKVEPEKVESDIKTEPGVPSAPAASTATSSSSLPNNVSQTPQNGGIKREATPRQNEPNKRMKMM